MPNTVFSMDIQDDQVTGVLLNINHKKTVVVGCGATLIGSRSLEEAVVEIIQQTGFHDGMCRISFTAAHFFFRNLSLPFTDIRKLRKILPFELEETAPLEINRLLVDTIISTSEGEKANIVAAMVERDFLADRLSRLLALGLDPEIITVSGVSTVVRLMENPDCPPDLILLDIGLREATLVVALNRRIALIRPLCFDDGGSGKDYPLGGDLTKNVSHSQEVYSKLASAVMYTLLAAQIKETGMPIYLTGPIEYQRGLSVCLESSAGTEIRNCNLLSQHPFLKIVPAVEAKWVPWIMDSALALGLEDKKTRKGFNFRKDTFARKVSLKQYRHLFWKGATVAAVLVVVFGFFLWFSSMSLKAEEKAVTIQIRAVFSETLPTVTRIVDPVQQLQSEINKLKQSERGNRTGNQYKVLDLLAEISERIPNSLKVRLTLMSVDEKGIRIKGVTDNFNTVDTVKKKLEKSSYFSSVTINSANLAPKNNEIRFELKLQPREL